MPSPRILKIGRDPSNSFILTHRSISRFHVEVFINEVGQVFITDLNSSNGTFINGNRLSGSALLEPGDILRLGIEKPIKWQKWTSEASQITNQPNLENSILDESYPNPQTGMQKFKKYIIILGVIILLLASLFVVLRKIEQNKEEKKTQNPIEKFILEKNK